jgi:hypothetical protein
MRRTFFPIKATADETLMDVVVFPTPPFWFVIAMIKSLSPSTADRSEITFIMKEDLECKRIIVLGQENVGRPTFIVNI